MAGTNAQPTGQVVDDLTAIARALEDTPSLTRLLIDATAPLEGRQLLVDRAFASQSAAARTAVKTALTQDWLKPARLVRALRLAAINAAWEWADDADNLRAAIDDVFAFGRTLMAHPELRRALTDRRATPAAREALAIAVTADLAPQAAAVIRVAVGGDDDTLDDRVRAGVLAGVERSGAVLAEVTVARALDGAQKERLTAALTRRYNAPTIIEEIVTPSVLGGVRVQCGADVIDATMGSRLEAARRAFA